MNRGGGRASVVREHGERLEFARGLVCARVRQSSYADPSPGLFSFNSPVGACDACRGFGRVIGVDWDKVHRPTETRRSRAGRILAWKGKSTEWERKELAQATPRSGESRSTCRCKKLTRGPAQVAASKATATGWRQVPGASRAGSSGSRRRTYKMHVRVLLSRYRELRPVRDLPGRALQRDGARVPRRRARPRRRGTRSSVERGHSARARRRWPSAADDAAAELAAARAAARASRTCRAWASATSRSTARRARSRGGEAQRVPHHRARRLAHGALFVLDEPTVGLHPSDVARLADVVRGLAERATWCSSSSTIRSVIARCGSRRRAGAGRGRQRAVRSCSTARPAQLAARRTPRRARAARTQRPRAPRARASRRRCSRSRARAGHNLQDVDAAASRSGVLRASPGRAARARAGWCRGRSLPRRCARARARRDATPAAPSTRSKGSDGDHQRGPRRSSRRSGAPRAAILPPTRGPGTRSRKRFAAEPLAQERGSRPGTSRSTCEGGRCEACKGEGSETVEMQFLADVSFGCPECGGKRFVGPVLDVRHAGSTSPMCSR